MSTSASASGDTIAAVNGSHIDTFSESNPQHNFNPDPSLWNGLSDEDLKLNLSAFSPKRNHAGVNPADLAVESTSYPLNNNQNPISPTTQSSNRNSSLLRRLVVLSCLLFLIIVAASAIPVYMILLNNDNRFPSNQILDPPPSNITVGVYYYPWHSRNFYRGDYLRRFIGHLPTLGEYDDSDPFVISQHLKWSRQSNVRLWIASWWGPQRVEDDNIRNTILVHPELGDHKIGLFYETLGRFKNGLSNIEPDMEYLCTEYFHHPNYFRNDARPVLFVYLTRRLEVMGTLTEVIPRMRSAVASACGEQLFVIGDHVWGEAPMGPDIAFQQLDAVTNYDVYGNMKATGLFATKNEVDTYYDKLNGWKQAASRNGCGFVSSVTPGFSKNGRPNNTFQLLARQIDGPESSVGSLFRYSLFRARYLVDSTVQNLLLVTSFNEWAEDTQIEPANGPPSIGEALNHYTEGVVYYGYGDLYLRILRNATVDSDKTEADKYANFDN